jgi:hypothetical protein
MEYWHDWILYYRSKEDFERLANKIPSKDVSISFDDTGIQMLLNLKK